MRNVSDKCCRENQNTYVRFIDFLFYRILPFMNKCERNMIQPDRTRDSKMLRRKDALCVLDN